MGRLRIVKPKDEGVFQYLQEIRGRQVVCDMQLYLDVACLTNGTRIVTRLPP